MPEAPYTLIDIGANLTHDSFDADREAVIERAIAVGVQRMVVTGSTGTASIEAADLAASKPGLLYATAGVHPHHADDYSSDVHALLESLLARPEVVAAGECGLDYFRNFSTHENQKKAFEAQLDLAVEHQMPIFLHQRDAHDDFIEILRKHLHQLPRAVAHCFTGDESELREYIDMDLYIGITGWICDERRGSHLQDIVHLIPDDRLMIETDAPYLLPRTMKPRPKSRRNEPMYLPEVLNEVAKARQRPAAEVARLTTANALRFFSLDD